MVLSSKSIGAAWSSAWALAACAIAASSAFADAADSGATLTLRGGFSRSLDEIPYSVTNDLPERLFTIDRGRGGFGEADVVFATPIRGVAVQMGGSYLRVTGKGDTGTPRDHSCQIDTFLGLISDCQDIALIQTSTRKATADALVRWRPFASGLSTVLMLGPTYLSLKDKNASQYLFSGGSENFVDRDTSVHGIGVKGGLEHSFRLSSPGFYLNAAILGSIVRAQRSIHISDRETVNGVFNQLQTLDRSDSTSVLAWEARLSFSNDLTLFGTGATIEYGVKYEQTKDVLFTSNTVATQIQPVGGYGKDKDDFTAWSGFVGVKVPLYK